MDDYPANAPDQPINPLTRRGLEILVLLSGDSSNQEIADQLYLALNSMKWYVSQIDQKLGVTNRHSAITHARALGLLVGSATPATQKHNLPILLTSFIGRQKEIAAVCRLLAEHRLETLTSSGGTGKPRVSLQVADQLLEIPQWSLAGGVGR